MSRLRAQVERLTQRDRTLWLTAFLALLPVYLLTAHWYGVVNVDTIATAWPSWQLVHDGSMWLERAPGLPPDIPWFTEAHGHVVSNRMPGVVLIGVPAQAALAFLDPHALTPAVLTAVLVTSAAMANLALAARRMGATGPLALSLALALGLGTGFWTNASAELWPHGPDALWISLCVLALLRDRLWLTGACWLPLVLTRPHLALVAAALGIVLAGTRRSARPLLTIGAPAGLGLLGVMCWNRLLYGRFSVSGGYGYTVDNAGDVSAAAGKELLESVAGGLVSPLRGMLLFSPLVLVGAFAATRSWRAAPDWARALAVGAVLYQLLEWHINGFKGGLGFYSFRYPLEALALCLPLGCYAYLDAVRSRPWLATAARVTTGMGIATHVVGAFWFQPLKPGVGQDFSAWDTSGLLQAAGSRGLVGTWVAAGVFMLVLATICWPRAPREQREQLPAPVEQSA